ncbi:hypothetical protein T492DRAFT_177005 [Pavlovales sp. CCMP2436]|nr:hypothetical protein T492DRAFT_177005 [Pavlovales sp. CCMP2436]
MRLPLALLLVATARLLGSALWAQAELAFNGLALVAAGSYALVLRPPYFESASPLPISHRELARALAWRRAPLGARGAAELTRRGYVHVRGALPTSLVRALRAALEAAPPHAPPLLGAAAAFALQRADVAFAALGQARQTNLSAKIVLRALAGEGEGVSLLNSLVYGIGAEQRGAGWHVDAPSYHLFDVVPTRGGSRLAGGKCAAGAVRARSARECDARSGASWGWPPGVQRRLAAAAGGAAEETVGGGGCAALRAVSVWLPLQDINEPRDGGALRFVSRASAAELSTLCIADALTGRPTSTRNASAGECRRRLDARSERLGALRVGDAVLFAPDVYHRTSRARPDLPLRTRWAYVERWALADARYTGSALDWLREVPLQPPCAHGLVAGDAVRTSACHPTVLPSELSAKHACAPSAAIGACLAAPPTPPLWARGPAWRCVLMFAHLGTQPRNLRAYFSYFWITQLLEIPIYSLFAARPAELPACAIYGALASLVTHPAAYSLTQTTGWLLDAVAPRWRRAAALVRWAVIEVAVVAVEARWLQRTRGPAMMHAWSAAIAANVGSVVGGWLLLRVGDVAAVSHFVS